MRNWWTSCLPPFPASSGICWLPAMCQALFGVSMLCTSPPTKESVSYIHTILHIILGNIESKPSRVKKHLFKVIIWLKYLTVLLGRILVLAGITIKCHSLWDLPSDIKSLQQTHSNHVQYEMGGKDFDISYPVRMDKYTVLPLSYCRWEEWLVA